MLENKTHHSTWTDPGMQGWLESHPKLHITFSLTGKADTSTDAKKLFVPMYDKKNLRKSGRVMSLA